MSEDKPAQQMSAKKKKSDKRVKIIFLLVLFAGVVTVWLIQRRDLPLKGWSNDLKAAMKQAREEDRRVLAFFLSSPPSQTARDLQKITLRAPENIEAIEKGKFIRVKVETSLKSDFAMKYKITTLPTLVIFSPDGKELNRREGFLAQAEFPEGFLGLENIKKPEE